MKKIRWKVFLPPWLLLILILILNLTDYDSFVAVIDFCTAWIMEYFTGGFCLLTFLCVLLIAVTYFSPMGQGVLLLSGGIENCSEGLIKSGILVWFVSTAAIVIIFVIAAITGITRGIQKLSSLNSVLYMLLGIAVLLFGPTLFLFNFGIEGIGNYLQDFFRISLYTGATQNPEWVRSWPGFYWCNWLAWMPITAIFLGKISRGYTIRQMIRTVVVIPALFSMLWIILFSGMAVHEELENGSVYQAIQTHGTEAATYTVLESLPFSKIIIVLFLAVLLISFVTAADSNTNAMSSLCTEGLTPEDSDSPAVLKILWGFTIGAICFIMLASYGVDGIKKLSNLGGFPDALLMIGFMLSWIRILRDPENYREII